MITRLLRQRNRRKRKNSNSSCFQCGFCISICKKQIDFGPRVPESKAHEQCAEWLVSMLDGFPILFMFRISGHVFLMDAE